MCMRVVAGLALVALAEASVRVNTSNLPVNHFPEGHFSLREPDLGRKVPKEVLQDPMKMAMNDASAAVGAASSANAQAHNHFSDVVKHLKAPAAKAPSGAHSNASKVVVESRISGPPTAADKSREEKGALTSKLGGDKDGNAFDADYILHRPNKVAPGDSKTPKPVGDYGDIAMDNGKSGTPPALPPQKGPRSPSVKVASLPDQVRYDNYDSMVSNWRQEYGPDGPKGKHSTHQLRPKLVGWGPLHDSGTPRYSIAMSSMASVIAVALH